MVKYSKLKKETEKLSGKMESWATRFMKIAKKMGGKWQPSMWKDNIQSLDKDAIQSFTQTGKKKIDSLQKTGKKKIEFLTKEGKKKIETANQTGKETLDYLNKKKKNLQKNFDKLKKDGSKKMDVYKKEAKNKRNNFFYYAIEKLEKHFPIGANPIAGKWFGNFSYRFNRRRRNIALQQIKMAFPNWSVEKIQQTAIESFESLGKTFFETIKKIEYGKNIDNWLENTNPQVTKAITKTGAIIINGHFANWEFGTYSFELAKLKGILLGKEDHELAKWFSKHFRNAKGFETIASTDKNLPFKIINTLKKKHCLHLLIDLDVLSESVYCEFFGRETRTVVSPARLAIKYNQPVVSCFNYRTRDGKHIFCYEFLSKPPYSKEMSEEKLTQIYTTALEKHIRKYPSQWRWAESRWKPERWNKRTEKTAN